MADLSLRWGAGGADLVLEGADLALDDGLETAILISLFTDRRTDDPESVPSGDGDARGWWGDAVPVTEGDLIGSRLWLLSREKQGPSVLRRAEEYAREALQWLIEDRIADKIVVVADSPQPGWWTLEVIVHRPRGERMSYRFHRTWDTQSERRP